MVDVVALHNEEFGEPGAPALVILHGLLGSSRNWTMAARGLGQSFHVFTLDLRDHGKSPHTEVVTIDRMANDVRHWTRSRGFDRVHLLGHSLGGKVAMRLACAFPDCVQSLCVVDIAPKNYRPHTVELRAMSSIDPSQLAARKDADEQLAKAGVEDIAMRQFLLTNLARTDAGLRWQVHLEALLRHVEELAQSPLKKGDRFGGQTLFVIGGKSAYVEDDDRPAVLEHFPAARFEVLESSGHNPHYECREEFGGVVTDFVRRTV